MRLSMTTDYAIRCLMYLSQNTGVSTSQKVCEYTGISSDEHTRKILRRLKQGGLVRSDQGAKGGYSLARPLSSITFLDVILCTDDTIHINPLPFHPPGFAEKQQAVQRYYAVTQEMIAAYFSSVTIPDILEGKLPVWTLQPQKTE